MFLRGQVPAVAGRPQGKAKNQSRSLHRSVKNSGPADAGKGIVFQSAPHAFNPRAHAGQVESSSTNWASGWEVRRNRAFFTIGVPAAHAVQVGGATEAGLDEDLLACGPRIVFDNGYRYRSVFSKSGGSSL